MKTKVILLTLVSLLLNSTLCSASSLSTSVYLQERFFEVISPTCKSLFPHKKMIYSSHLQRWKTDNNKAINKAKEDMMNLATLLGQSESMLSQQKVESANVHFQQSTLEEKTVACAKLEAL